jgi:capsular exopolysaccharide synthesis family protein
MLQLTSPRTLISPRPEPALQADEGLELLTALKAHWAIVVASVAVSLAAAIVIIAMTPPLYIAQSRVFFDPRRGESSRPASDRDGGQISLDAAQLESQIQLLKSEQISRPVIEAHRLNNNPDFTAAPALWRRLLQSVLPVGVRSDPSYNIVSTEFDRRLDVRRLGQSYVLSVSFQSSDPNQAAQLSNAATAAYVAHQLSQRSEGMQRNQFERPVQELNAKVAIAEQAVRSGVIDISVFPAADARVISAALIPTGPSAPRRSLILAFAASLGLLVGGVTALILHGRRRAIYSPGQVERRLGVPCLGLLPRLKARLTRKLRRDWSGSAMTDPRMVAFSTQMRTIRTSFEMIVGQQGGHCIAVTSTADGEGKSLTALGLALAFAVAGRRTLLIDANPRNPSLTRRMPFDAKNRSTAGLVQVLAGEYLSTAVYPSEAPNLSLMPVGDDFTLANFSDNFDSDAAREVFKHLRLRFDRVIIDLPAFTTLPDAWAIGAVADSYVLVVRAGKTAQREIESVTAALRFASAAIAGVVLNRGS